MDRLSFQDGELNKFIQQVLLVLRLNSDDLGKMLGVSGRTIRDWKREKFKPSKDLIVKMHNFSGVSLPKSQILSQYWNAPNAGRVGGKRRYKLYGALGTYESRVKGGVMSWYKRRKDPELLSKYTNTFNKPDHSPNFAEFVGIMLGDGGLTSSQLSVYLSSETDQEFAYYVCELIKTLFNLTPSIYKSKRAKFWTVSLSSMNLVKYLTAQGLCAGNKVQLQVGVPVWIYSDLSYIKSCIRGLIDTDGCFSIHKYKVNGKEYFYPKIIFVNRSEPLLEFVYQGLIKIGLHPKRPYKYQVWIHNQNEVYKYLQEVGVSNYKPVVKRILEKKVFGEVA